jgi:hypothetical protein
MDKQQAKAAALGHGADGGKTSNGAQASKPSTAAPGKKDEKIWGEATPDPLHVGVASSPGAAPVLSGSGSGASGFIGAPAFTGSRPGYVFKQGPEGVVISLILSLLLHLLLSLRLGWYQGRKASRLESCLPSFLRMLSSFETRARAS